MASIKVSPHTSHIVLVLKKIN